MPSWRGYLAVVGLVGVIDTAFLLGIISGYAKKLGAGDAEAGFIAGLYSMVAIPASLLAGALVDAIGRRRSLSIGLAWDTASMILYGVVDDYRGLAMVRGLHAVGGSLVYPAYMAIVGDSSPRDRRGREAGRYLAVVALAVALGSLTSSIIVHELGFKPALRLIALIVFAGFIASLRIPETRPRREAMRGLGGQLSHVIHSAVTILLLYIGFGAIIGGMPQALLNQGLVGVEEEASAITGAIIGIASLASIPAFIIAGRLTDIRGPAAALALGGVLVVISQLAILGSTSIYTMMAAAIPYGAAIAAVMTVSTFMAISVEGARGSSVAIQQIANIAGVAVGAPLGGVLAGMKAVTGVALAVASTGVLLLLYSNTLRSLASSEV